MAKKAGNIGFLVELAEKDFPEAGFFGTNTIDEGRRMWYSNLMKI